MDSILSFLLDFINSFGATPTFIETQISWISRIIRSVAGRKELRNFKSFRVDSIIARS